MADCEAGEERQGRTTGLHGSEAGTAVDQA